MLDELDPLCLTIYGSLTTLMEEKITSGQHSSISLSRFSFTALVFSSLLIAAAIFFSILLGIFVSRSLSRPISQCAARLDLLAGGDLSSPVPEIYAKDETGVLASSTGKIVSTVSGIIEDLGFILSKLGKGNFTVASQDKELYIGDFHSMLDSVQQIISQLTSTLNRINGASDQVAGGAD